MESSHRVEINSSTYRWLMDYIEKTLSTDKEKLTNVTTEHNETQVIRGRIQALKQLTNELGKFLPK